MTELQQYRNRLETELAKLKSTEVSSVQNTDGRIDIIEEYAENADEVIDAAEVERDLALEEHIIESIKLIESALERIDKGYYGVCIDCSMKIPSARLEAFPAAARCITCKEEYEVAAREI